LARGMVQGVKAALEAQGGGARVLRGRLSCQVVCFPTTASHTC
jgi:hypothetical protein